MGEVSNGLPEELVRRMDLARDAQKVEGFEWRRISHLKYVDVPGMRYVPNLGRQMRQKFDRHGWFRWFALPLIIVPLLVGRDVWVSADPMYLKLLYSAGLGIIVAAGGFLFWVLGPDRSVKITAARHGLYFTPNSFSLWSTKEDGQDNILFVSREQILRFFNEGGSASGSVGTAHASLWVEFRRVNGELSTRRTGLPAVGSADREWLEHWRTTGEL